MTSLAQLLALAALILPRLLVPQGLTVSLCLCDLLTWDDACVACELADAPTCCCDDVEVPSCCADHSTPAPPTGDGERVERLASCDGCLSVELEELEVPLSPSVDVESAAHPPLAAVEQPRLLVPRSTPRLLPTWRAPPGAASTPAGRAGALPLRN